MRGRVRGKKVVMGIRKRNESVNLEDTCSGSVSRFSVAESESIWEEDQISKIPEDILCSVISMLKLKEAATTSILSSKWRYLWRKSLNLDFDVANMTGKEPMLGGSGENQPEEINFVRWVNQILDSHLGEKIESFRINYSLGREYGCHVDQWIQFAIDKAVQQLVVDLDGPRKISDHDKLYTFPFHLFSEGEKGWCRLKHLSLNACSLGLHPDFSSLSSLTSLTLEYVSITEDNMENIMKNCLLLQWLRMRGCHCPPSLRFSGSRLQLKHLSIRGCDFLKEIEISGAINLVSLECNSGMLKGLSSKNILRLQRLYIFSYSELYYGINYALGGLANDFPQLETLFLLSPPIKGDKIPKQLPTFTKLKKLGLFIDSSWPETRSVRSLLELTSSLLEASPFLQKLELHLPCIYYRKREMLKIASDSEFRECHRHKYLEDVEIYNFRGYQSEVDLIMYLLNNCLSLEKMTIDRQERSYVGDGEWGMRWSSDVIVYRRWYIRRLLRTAVPPTTRLVVL